MARKGQPFLSCFVARSSVNCLNTRSRYGGGHYKLNFRYGFIPQWMNQDFFPCNCYIIYILISPRMNSQRTKITLTLLAIVAALTLITAVAVTSQAFAQPSDDRQGGPKDRPNGQCKQLFNDNVCKKFNTGPR